MICLPWPRALTDMGYERVKLVDIPGTFSMRGSLVDIFPIEGERPVRIEFFDDEIDTMRYFNPADQLSQEACPALAIIPAHELPLTEQAGQRALEALEAELAKTAATLRGAPKHNLLERYQPFVENLRQGQWDYGMEQLACLLYPEPYTLLDYIDGGTLILSEPEAVHFTVDELADSRRSRYSDMLEARAAFAQLLCEFLDVADFEAALAKRPLLCFSRLPLPEDSLLRQIPFYCRVLPP